MAEPVLSMRNVRKSFGKQLALDDVSFSASRAELIGLLGPNGAGKTTLLLVASGLLASDAGEVSLFGLGFNCNRSEILSRVGVVFQSRSLDLEITVRSALRFHGALFGLRRAELDERIDETAELLEITSLLDRRVGTLSGGNVRRVEIARALLNRPDLVLMDEATVGLDPVIRLELLGHVRRLCAERQVTVVWATHLLDEVANADRVAVMVRGRLQMLSPSDLGMETLAEAYGRLVGSPLV